MLRLPGVAARLREAPTQERLLEVVREAEAGVPAHS